MTTNPATQPQSQDKPKTILIVEDDFPLQAAIKDKLEQSGFKTIVARGAQEGLALLKDANNIAALWLDHYLVGGADGLFLLAEIKKEGSPFRNTPIYVVSNTGSHAKKEAYIRLGADKYFVKADNRLSDIVDDLINYLNGEEESEDVDDSSTSESEPEGLIPAA